MHVRKLIETHLLRVSIAQHSPKNIPRFETEFRDALREAATSFDLGSVEAVLTR